MRVISRDSKALFQIARWRRYTIPLGWLIKHFFQSLRQDDARRINELINIGNGQRAFDATVCFMRTFDHYLRKITMITKSLKGKPPFGGVALDRDRFTFTEEVLNLGSGELHGLRARLADNGEFCAFLLWLGESLLDGVIIDKDFTYLITLCVLGVVKPRVNTRAFLLLGFSVADNFSKAEFGGGYSHDAVAGDGTVGVYFRVTEGELVT